MNTRLDPFSKFEHEGWQRVATRFEEAWSELTRLFIPSLLEASGIETGKHLPDVSCGRTPGQIRRSLRKTYPDSK